jgi:hypothetical protein
VVDVVLFRSGRKAHSYLLVSALLVKILSIHADDADDADDVVDVDGVNDVDGADDVGDASNADDADLAKTLLPTKTLYFEHDVPVQHQ